MSAIPQQTSGNPRHWQERLIVWSSKFSNPREGWWTLFLAWMIVRAVAVAIRSAAWVPEVTAVPRLTFWSLVISFIVAKRVSSPRRAWVYIMGYGIMLPFFTLANLWPDGFTQAPSRLNLTTFALRMRSWGQAVWIGEPTQETAVFTFLLLIACWLLISYFGWMTFYYHRPMPAILLLAVGIGFNSYFAEVRLYLVYLFAIFSLALLVTNRQAALENEWQKAGVEFPTTIKEGVLQLLGYVGGGLLILTFFVADASSYRVAYAFSVWPPVQQVEAWLEQSLGGVNSAREVDFLAASTRNRSVLPRSYLLGNAPELYETVVMRATVSTQNGETPRLPLHWRNVSYDTYTGFGWSRSDEIEAVHEANVVINSAPISATTTLSQRVIWLLDKRSVRYAQGLLLSFEDEVTVHQRANGELVWVEGEATIYTAVSQASTASVEQLSAVKLAETDPEILNHYTQLPKNLPLRVHELAQEIVAEQETPFAQAKAIEQFVRQYTYSLDISAPPPGRDVVDFFLFDLQAGYCDYYATSMVVLARSVGLPARMGSGYVTHAPNEAGVQTIFEIDGHSWAEVYFEGYGWIEFEPTAGFLSPDDGVTAVNPQEIDDDSGESSPLPRGDRANWELVRLIGVIGITVFGVGWLIFRQWRFSRTDVSEAYGQLIVLGQQMGLPISVTMTPYEMEQVWVGWLDSLRHHPWVQFWIRLNGWLLDFKGYVQQLIKSYIAVSYSAQKGVGGKRPFSMWKLSWIIFWVRLLAATDKK